MGANLGVRKNGKKIVKKKAKIKNRFFANKTLDFCPIFINLGLLKAELSDKTGNMFRFYLSFIRIAQSKSKVEGKNRGQDI